MRGALPFLCVLCLVSACSPAPAVHNDGRPAWNAALAAKLPGKTVLIGTTYRVGNGAPDRVEERWGTIRSTDPDHGIEVVLSGVHNGQVFWLPPHMANLLVADKGSYRLRSTGELVVNPDYISNWTINAPDDGGDD